VARESAVLGRQPQDALLAQAATWLAAGRLRFAADPGLKLLPIPEARAAAVSAPPPPAPPRRPLPSVPVPPPPEPNPLDFVDHDLQAAALIAAALEGVPFCEECKKAKEAKAKQAASA
jgi:hypothetical protein